MLKMATSTQQEELEGIIAGLLPVDPFTIADELIEAGFIAQASYEFESAEGAKVYVSVFVRAGMKAVYINLMGLDTGGQMNGETIVFANAPWNKLID